MANLRPLCYKTTCPTRQILEVPKGLSKEDIVYRFNYAPMTILYVFHSESIVTLLASSRKPFADFLVSIFRHIAYKLRRTLIEHGKHE
jgi:hypothetical protein